MYTLRQIRRWSWLAALAGLAWFAPAASASCLVNPDPQISRLQELVEQDASLALTQARNLLSAISPMPVSEISENAARAAALYAVEAQAYSILELDTESRAAADKGFALAPNRRDPVHLELLMSYADSVYDKAGLTAAIEAIEAARALQAPGSIADTCLLIRRGLLEHRQSREDLAIVTLTQAYRASIAPQITEPHIMSADTLSLVMRSMGDFTQALALNQEKIDWDAAHGATMALSVSRFMRGQILKLMGNYNGAIGEFTQARKLSESLADSQGVAFADQRICESHFELGLLKQADRECFNALRLFSAAKAMDSVKETQFLQARIDLASGHAERALESLDSVLDLGGADMLPREVGAIYEARAQANAALHNYREAYADLQEFSKRYRTANDAERIMQAGALRARFETDREVERNATLQRELASSQERSHRQAAQLRWNAVVVITGIWVIVLLIYFLIANRRYRQQLQRLASQDSLTGLPNRRRTVELAMAALQEANEANRPLTIAVIDMDHFKVVNDRCGHATGDFVLTEFARAGREALRDPDILGRWGGEEFLLVMPDTPLELAAASLDRLRTLVYGIKLPATASGLRVSFSAGLASTEIAVLSLDELIARADEALYMAKNEGRDQIRLAGSSSTTHQTSNTGSRRALRLLRLPGNLP
jgi:diguanylate cyclase (GGDEF)-like protein